LPRWGGNNVVCGGRERGTCKKSMGSEVQQGGGPSVWLAPGKGGILHGWKKKAPIWRREKGPTRKSDTTSLLRGWDYRGLAVKKNRTLIWVRKGGKRET